ncbi:AMP-binding protein [Streptomyces sp. NPDC059629]|uniref:AMP-binding protein n=1 Tax=Streptomyces sp. NPDC059629 TaxID=3346889 RepID=UPI003689958F
MNGLLAWVDSPSSASGIHFATGDGWDWWPYDRLAAEATTLSGGLAECGVRRDDVVMIVLPAGADMVLSLYGAMLSGATVSPVAPAAVWHQATEYDEHLARIARMAEPRAVITRESSRERVQRAVGPGRPVVTPEQLRSAGSPLVRAPAATALLQLTSGSSHSPRGVRVSRRALEANVAAIAEWLGVADVPDSAHWMPLHHDMGLIGGLFTPVSIQGTVRSLRPGHFVRDPLRYLRCFGEQGAAVGTMPNFGLEQVINRVTPEDLAGLDFSGWRALIVGAERLNPVLLERFHDLLAPFGFARRALTPAYGLAEATLAVTGLAPPRDPRYARLTPGAPATLHGPTASPEGGVVGCGTPLAGVRVWVRDGEGRPAPDGVVGEIMVSGSSLADGYQAGPQQDGDPAPSDMTFDGTVLRTGDAGFMLRGELFPLGRLCDSIKVRGRVVFAEDLERSLHSLGLPSYEVAVLLGLAEGGHRVVAVVENPPPLIESRIVKVLERETGGLPVSVITGPLRTIERTTSGKPRRRAMWRRYLAGQLGTAAESPAV